MLSRVRISSSTAASTIQHYLKLPIIAVRTRTATTRNTAVAALVAGTMLSLTATPRATAQLGGTTTSTTTTIANATTPPQARLIEWDLPANADSTPGAMVVDTMGHDKNRVWFVTRLGVPHVYRLETPRSLMKGSARWTAWELSELAMFTGGIRKVRASHDRRFVYVRTITLDGGSGLERVDTQNCTGGTCERMVWIDPAEIGMDVSDVAVDDKNNVYTTHSPQDNPALSYVQRLTPGYGSAAVTRWRVGGGAGICGTVPASINSPCIAGISVHPSNRNLIYYSEASSNSISELNVGTSTVRRWSLNELSAACAAASASPCAAIAEPRQLHIDRWGKVWVITGSGHIVSLDPCTNKMTSHYMPDKDIADPFGIAPDDDVVGYTASRSNKVGMLFPKGNSFRISPSSSSAPKTTDAIPADPQRAAVTSGCVSPQGKTVAAQITSQPDGTFIEAQIAVTTNSNNSGNTSTNPLGITPVKSKSQGTFFYAVGTPVDPADTSASPMIDRIGFVRLPIKDKIKHPRDDDDRDDGWDGEDGWHGWHGHGNSHDNDDDGIDDDDDSPSGHENVDSGDAAPLAAGQAVDYKLTASSSTLALIAKAAADDPLAQIGIDIYDAMGLLVARSAPTPGLAVAQVALPAAGNYTARVRNYGLSSVNQTPTMIVREPLDLTDPLLP